MRLIHQFLTQSSFWSSPRIYGTAFRWATYSIASRNASTLSSSSLTTDINARLWTAEEIAKLRDLIKLKLSDAEIAREMDRSLNSIRCRRLQNLDGGALKTAPSYSYARKVWSQDELDQIWELRAEGYSTRFIADAVGCEQPAVRRKLRGFSSPDTWRHRSWTSEEALTAQSMRIAGHAVHEIACALKRSEDSVKGKLQRDNRPAAKKPSASPWTDAENQKLLELRQKSLSWDEIRPLFPQRSKKGIVHHYHQHMKAPKSSQQSQLWAPWTQTELDTLVQMKLSGDGLEAIASRLNRGRRTVERKIYAIFAGTSDTYHKWSQDSIAKLRRMREEGKSFRNIALELGDRTAHSCKLAYHRHCT